MYRNGVGKGCRSRSIEIIISGEDVMEVTDEIRKPINTALSFVFEDFDLTRHINDSEIEYFSKLLKPQSPSFLQRQARLAFQAFSDSVSTRCRLATFKVLKNIRKATALTEMKRAGDCLFNRKVLELDKLGLKRRGYKGMSSAVCLSYDVDRLVGYEYLEELAEILLKHNMKATFNILTNWEYKIDWKKINVLKEAGFEIGLHGGRHDISLGYRSIPSIGTELKRALSDIPFKVYGYRAPALCMSQELMDVVAELGFLYDSSLPMTNMYYKSVESCFPYPCHAGNLWEFPVTIQDSTLFLDLNLSQGEALNRMTSNIDGIVKHGGVNIINLHPYIVIEQTSFHQKLLDYLTKKGNLLFCSQKEFYDYIQSVTPTLSGV